jgi:RimJ/RimL family protein N-acetyltransferase
MRVPIDLALRALDWPDAEKARTWRNDWRIIRWCRQRDVISDVEQDRWYRRQSEDPSIQMYGVWLKASAGGGELVGVCGLTSLDWFNRRAEFSLYTAPERQRQGLGRAALQLLLAHAFENLALEQVWGETLEGNPAMKVFDALGFKLDGTRRSFYWKDGRYWDAHLISITRSEWKNGLSARPTPIPEPGEPRGDAGAPEATHSPAARRAGGRGGRKRGIAAVLDAELAPTTAPGVGPGRPTSGDPGAEGTRADT